MTQDALSTYVNETDQSTASFSHTTGTLTNGLMLIFIAHANGTPPTVTYNGVPCTFVDSYNEPGANSRQLSLFKLVAPPSGAHTISITSCPTGFIKACVVTISGVDQSTPLSTIVKARNTSSNPSTTVVSTVDSLVYMGIVGANDGPTTTCSPGSGETELIDAGTSSHISLYEYRKAGAASVTMTETLSASSKWAAMGVSVNPPSAASGNFFLLM